MKPFLRIVLTLAAAVSAVFSQSSPPQTPAGLAAAQPFRIDRGTSFDASAPAGKAGYGANAARRQVLSSIEEAEAIIAEKYVGAAKLDAGDLTHSALTSMLHSLDPHSNFYDRTEWTSLLDEQNSGYAGVGISFAAFSKGHQTGMYVLSTVPGTAAARSGLKFGDRIVSVDGVAVEGKTSDEVRVMIRGAVGTAISIEIETADQNRQQTVKLVRSMIPQPSVPDAYMIRPGVGYIDLTVGFSSTTADEVTAALRRLHQGGMTSLIIDLRGNRGGIVDQAVKVAEKFLPAGALIVSQRGRSDMREWRSSNISPEKLPLVLLVDENTASASEILAGALQDSDRALIVGQRTFGKGLVQDVFDLPANTGLTLTAARYYTPTGRSIQRDYSEIGRYEYFSHRGRAADIDKPYYEARTVTGRRVFGGDGISPDEEVQPTELKAAEIHILDAIFYFTRDLFAGRIANVAQPRKTSVAPGFNVSKSNFAPKDSLLKAFSEYLRSNHRWNIEDNTLLQESAFIDIHLRQAIAMADFGSKAADQVLVGEDQTVLRAVSIMPGAAELTRTAAKYAQFK